jgi:hypothetical protein
MAPYTCTVLRVYKIFLQFIALINDVGSIIHTLQVGKLRLQRK